tara:strand:- start:20964 stop:21602 length:639 start_codon:yes stop_codon:yes gene_type:complete
MAFVIDKRSGYTIREGTNDKTIISECRAYFKTLTLDPDRDVVMDIGGHIGIFADMCYPTRVVSYEPLPANAKLYLENSPNSALREGAMVYRPKTATIPLYVSETSDQSNHTLVQTRGRKTIDVPTFSFESSLEIVRPTVLKLDIEGGEYDLLEGYGTKLPVRIFLAEFHFRKKADAARAEALWAGLDDHFDQVLVQPKVAAWNTFGVWASAT